MFFLQGVVVRGNEIRAAATSLEAAAGFKLVFQERSGMIL